MDATRQSQLAAEREASETERGRQVAPQSSPDYIPKVTTTKHADLIYDVGLHKGEESILFEEGFRVIALPGRWLTKEEMLKKGRCFIFGFNFWGGRGLQRNRLGERIPGVLKRLAGRPLAGWYDTHARLSTVKD